MSWTGLGPAFGFLTLVPGLSLACPGHRAPTSAAAITVRDALTQLARGEGDFNPLAVTVDHIAFQGGLQLTIRGDGAIRQHAVRTPVGDPRDKVSPDDLKALVARLVKHEAWTQRVDERPPVPDESRATLRTCYRDQCVEIWEWFNDLDKNARIGDVLKFMQTVAWKPAERASR